MGNSLSPLFPENRLFAYGTLMFPDVVERLLDRPVPASPATLDGFRRVAIDRGAGGAKGPIVFHAEGHAVDGMVLSDLSAEEQAMLHYFEDAAGGYVLEEVAVEVAGDPAVRAGVYVASPELHELIVGEWRLADFEGPFKDHYLSERIPLIRQRWKEVSDGR